MVTKLSEVDRDALERALKIAQASEPGERDARTAAYTCQRRALQLRPWQSPPCYGDASPGHDGQTRELPPTPVSVTHCSFDQ